MSDSKQANASGECRSERLRKALCSPRSIIWYCLVLFTLLLAPNLIEAIRKGLPWIVKVLTVHPSIFYDVIYVLLSLLLCVFIWTINPVAIRFRHFALTSIVLVGYVSLLCTPLKQHLAKMELIPFRYGSIVLVLPFMMVLWRYLQYQWRLLKRIPPLAIERFDDSRLTVKDDLLNYTPLVEHVVDLLFEKDFSMHAIGIQGRYGIGKTTFLNFLEERIEARKKLLGGPKFEVVRFTPWRASEVPFANQLIELLTNACPDSKPQLAEAFRIFLGDLSKESKGGWTSMFLSSITPRGESADISKIKERIDRLLLSDSELRFVVYVDDLDRLLPDEIAQVLKLIRNTTDFNGITYVLTYDRKALEGSLRKIQGVEEGFMEKFVQCEINPPAVDQEILMNILHAELMKQLNEDNGVLTGIKPDQLSLGGFGIQLNTPREAKRLAAMFRVSYKSIIWEVDIHDALVIAYWRMRAPVIVHQVYVAMAGVPMMVEQIWERFIEPGQGTKRLWDRCRSHIEGKLNEVLDDKPTIALALNSFAAVFSGLNSSQHSISKHGNFDRYFNFIIPRGVIKEKDYNALINASGPSLNSLVKKIVEDGQVFSAVHRLSGDDSVGFVRALEIHTALARLEIQSHRRGQLIYSTDYGLIRARLRKGQYGVPESMEYHEFLLSKLGDAPYPAAYEMGIVLGVLGEAGMAQDEFLLSEEECTSHLARYVNLIIEKEDELNKIVSEALASCSYSGWVSHDGRSHEQIQRSISELPSLLLRAYKKYGPKAYFEYWVRLEGLPPPASVKSRESKCYVDRSFPIAFGGKPAFIEHLRSLEDDKYRNEFIRFFDEFVKNDPFTAIAFDFNELEPWRYSFRS